MLTPKSNKSGLSADPVSFSSISSNQHPDDSIIDQLKDTDAAPGQIVRQHRFLTSRFVVYQVGCLVVVGIITFLSVWLWSDMGHGQASIDKLKDNKKYSIYFALIAGFVLILLYILDYFDPPHLEGRYLVISDRLCCSQFGKICSFLAFAAIVAYLYLLADTYPTLPVVVTTFLGPVSVMILRRASMPSLPGRPQQFDGAKTLDDRINLIKLLSWEERDEQNFYRAATNSFALAGLVCWCVWLRWTWTHEEEFSSRLEAVAEDRSAQELLFVQWAAPACVGVSMFVFAGFTFMRVSMNAAYSATDQIKNQMILEVKTAESRKTEQFRVQMLRARAAAAQNQQELCMSAADKMQQYLIHHISQMRRLSKVVKAVTGTIVALILALHIAFQMTSAISHIGIMVQGYMLAYLLTFSIFTFVSFNRVSKQMSLEMLKMPMVKNLVAASRSTSLRALVLCLVLPALPLLWLLSALNQQVRLCRRIATRRPGQFVTDRVHRMIQQGKALEWLPLIGWIYICACVVIVFRISPVLLNVLLGWMSEMMSGLHFWVIFAVTGAVGTFLFMLPPVPGPVIYPFAGIVLSDPEKCPYGFFWGCTISIILCFVMKLAACALQQKGIGERLGQNLSVRQACGVHKPLMRAIEAVLTQPGLSWGKCMILCGGPDWPTSVLAGILKLSLTQCIIGTLPVGFSIIPMTLTGSFYLKRAESEVWTRTGNLMLFLTTAVSAVFWAGIGCAIQDEYDRNAKELTRPREEFLELEWLDHRAEQIAERCRVRWADVPAVFRWLYAGGAILAALCAHLFLWCSGRCFTAFTLTDDINDLIWFGSDGLIRPTGAVGFLLIGVSYSLAIAYKVWLRHYLLAPTRQAAAELDKVEDDWKAAWLAELSKQQPVTGIGPQRDHLLGIEDPEAGAVGGRPSSQEDEQQQQKQKQGQGEQGEGEQTAEQTLQKQQHQPGEKDESPEESSQQTPQKSSHLLGPSLPEQQQVKLPVVPTLLSFRSTPELSENAKAEEPKAKVGKAVAFKLAQDPENQGDLSL